MRYHFIPVRAAIVKNITDNKIAVESVEKRKPQHTVGKNVSWYSH